MRRGRAWQLGQVAGDQSSADNFLKLKSESGKCVTTLEIGAGIQTSKLPAKVCTPHQLITDQQVPQLATCPYGEVLCW